MTNIIGRNYLVDKIYKRLKGTVKKSDIRFAINIIINEIRNELINKRSISIKNFGTLTPYLFQAHKGINMFTKKIEMFPKTWSVKFHAHVGFLKLLELAKEKFATSQKDVDKDIGK